MNDAMMLGLFIGTHGISIVAGEDFALAPEIAADPHNSVTTHRLVATDAVIFNCEEREWFELDFAVIAFYEQFGPTKWELSIRKEANTEAS